MIKNNCPLVAIILIAVAYSIYGEETSKTEKESVEMVSIPKEHAEKKKQNILDLIRLTTIHPEVLELMVPNMVDHFISTLRKDVSLPEVIPLVKNRISSDSFLEPFAQLYADNFSSEEILKLVNFYKSDEAKKLNKIGQQIGGPIVAAFAPAIREVLSVFPDKEGEIRSKDDVISITKLNYEKEVAESRLPVVLDACSIFCGPCKAMEPIVGNLSKTLQGKVKFGKLSVDEELDLSKELSIQAMPTFLFIKNGKIIDRHVGAISKEDLTKKIEKKLLK